MTVTIDDYAFGGGGGEITWKVDGQEQAPAKNQRSITLTAGAPATPTKVEALLQFGNGDLVKAEKTLVPYYLDVIIEPFTYAPIQYRGRTLPINDSTITLTALLSGKDGLQPAANYSYNWQQDGKTLQGGTMRGSNKVNITVPYGNASQVRLSVADSMGSIIAYRTITIPVVDVDLQFYEVSSLYGLNRTAIGNEFRLLGNSATIRAVPYNLDRYSIASGLRSEWSLDGRTQTTDSKDPFEITFRKADGASSRVDFKVQHTSKFLQQGSGGFTIKF